MLVESRHRFPAFSRYLTLRSSPLINQNVLLIRETNPGIRTFRITFH